MDARGGDTGVPQGVLEVSIHRSIRYGHRNIHQLPPKKHLHVLHCYSPHRAEKEKLNKKVKEEEKEEEMDDSGFYAGNKHCLCTLFN